MKLIYSAFVSSIFHSRTYKYRNFAQMINGKDSAGRGAPQKARKGPEWVNNTPKPECHL